MSTKLYWKPVVKRSDKVLGYQLKYVLAPKYFGHDGSLRSSDPVIFTSEDIDFLEGVALAGAAEVKKEAKALISLIEKHDSVEVWIDE